MSNALYSFLAWLVSWGNAGLVLLVLIALCLNSGFPFKHRNRPPLDSVVFTIVGCVSCLAGLQLLPAARGLEATDPKFLPNLLGGVVTLWFGIDALIRGFRMARISRSTPTPSGTKSKDNV